jgi:hypothetical protein
MDYNIDYIGSVGVRNLLSRTFLDSLRRFREEATVSCLLAFLPHRLSCSPTMFELTYNRIGDCSSWSTNHAEDYCAPYSANWLALPAIHSRNEQ